MKRIFLPLCFLAATALFAADLSVEAPIINSAASEVESKIDAKTSEKTSEKTPETKSEELKDSKVYYPAGSNSGSSSGASSLAGAIPTAPANPVATTVLYLAFLGGLSYVAYLLWRRKISPQRTVAAALSPLEVINTRPLGNRQFLVVVRYKEKELLLGVGQGFITRLESSSIDSTPDEESFDDKFNDKFDGKSSEGF